MKLVLLMYLEGDEHCIERLLAETGVGVWSRLAVEGHGPGAPGWYGEVAPYDSRSALAIVPDDTALRLLAAVEGCRGVQDPAHPIHAFQVDVERTVACLCSPAGKDRSPS